MSKSLFCSSRLSSLGKSWLTDYTVTRSFFVLVRSSNLRLQKLCVCPLLNSWRKHQSEALSALFYPKRSGLDCIIGGTYVFKDLCAI